MTEIMIPPIYVCSTEEKRNIKESFVITNHPYHLFLLCTRGNGSIITEQMHEKYISKNMLIYISPALFTAIRVLSEDFSLRFLGFGGEAVAGLLEYCGMDMSYVIDRLPESEVKKFNSIFDIGTRDELRQSVNMYSFICGLYPIAAEPDKKINPIARAFEKFIRRNISEKIDFPTFCHMYDITENELRKLLKRDIDDIIRTCRIEEMKLMLITRPLEKLEILHKYCGFSSVTEMADEFKSCTGLSPEEYVKAYIPDVKNIPIT